MTEIEPLSMGVTNMEVESTVEQHQEESDLEGTVGSTAEQHQAETDLGATEGSTAEQHQAETDLGVTEGSTAEQHQAETDLGATEGSTVEQHEVEADLGASGDIGASSYSKDENPCTDDQANAQSDSAKENIALDKEESEQLLSKDSKEDEDNDVLGNGKLLKKVLKKGNGLGTRPMNGDIVAIHYVANLKDGTEVEKQDRLTFILGDMDVVNALDLCCCLMEQGEEAKIETDPLYAYGALGLAPSVPPEAWLVYHVTLLDVTRAQPLEQLSVAQRLLAGDKKRERGNFLFTRKDYSSAISCYTKALNLLDDTLSSSSDEADVTQQLRHMGELRIKCYCNLAAAQLKVHAFSAALTSCDHVLRAQPQNVKALYRKAKSLATMDEVPQSICILRQALKLSPQDKLLHSELGKLTAQQKQESAKQKQLYQKMLGTEHLQPTAISAKQQTHSQRWLWVGGGIAAVLSVGLAAYRFL